MTRPNLPQSGVTGVNWDERNGLWKVFGKFEGKWIHMGAFPYELLPMAIELRLQCDITEPEFMQPLRNKYTELRHMVREGECHWKPEHPLAIEAAERLAAEAAKGIGWPAGEAVAQDEPSQEPAPEQTELRVPRKYTRHKRERVRSSDADLRIGELLVIARKWDAVASEAALTHTEAKAKAIAAWNEYAAALTESLSDRGSAFGESVLGALLASKRSK